MCSKRRVFYVENNKNLLNRFQEVIKDKLDIELIPAYYLEQAKQIIGEQGPFDGYIIDIMLPQTEQELTQLTKKEGERTRLLDELISSTDLESESLDEGTVRLRTKIDIVDAEIKNLLNMQGGLELVELIAHKHSAKQDPEALKVPVIFWTARVAEELKEKCRRYVNKEFFKWLEKPEDVSIVAEELVRRLG